MNRIAVRVARLHSSLPRFTHPRFMIVRWKSSSEGITTLSTGSRITGLAAASNPTVDVPAAASSWSSRGLYVRIADPMDWVRDHARYRTALFGDTLKVVEGRLAHLVDALLLVEAAPEGFGQTGSRHPGGGVIT